MTPADLKAWQDGQALSYRAAAKALGVSPATYFDWLSGTSRNTGKPITKLSRTVALACAAIECGLKPIGEK